MQSQPRLDQMQMDDMLQVSGTGAVDGKDSSDSEEDQCESMHTKNNDSSGLTTRQRMMPTKYVNATSRQRRIKMDALNMRIRNSDNEYDDEDEDGNDTNITDDDDEENEVSSSLGATFF